MADLIDCDALMADIATSVVFSGRTSRNAEMRGANKIIDRIKAAPTVDAVEVVRCQDCKYWGDEDGKLKNSDGVLFARCKVHNYLLDGRHTGRCPTENDFCSYGELKEGAD